MQELTRALRGIRDRAGQGPEAFREVVVSLDGAAVYGKGDARVTLVEFSDYQCPFCARYAQETFPQIDRDYIQTGCVKYVFRDFPIESIHPQAFKTHEAVHCAGEQGKRREMHDKVFSNQRAVRAPDLATYAQALGLDAAGFQKCLEGGHYSVKVRKGVEEGQEAG